MEKEVRWGPRGSQGGCSWGAQGDAQRIPEAKPMESQEGDTPIGPGTPGPPGACGPVEPVTPRDLGPMGPRMFSCISPGRVLLITISHPRKKKTPGAHLEPTGRSVLPLGCGDA